MTKQQLIDQYDSWYPTGVRFDQLEITNVVQQIPRHISGIKLEALDIGGGRSSYALQLAQAGFDVTVQDISREGLQCIQQDAEAAQVAVKTIKGDITETGISGKYEVLLTAMLLHHLSVTQARVLLKDMRQQTKLGGLNLIATFLNSGEFYQQKKAGTTENFYPELAELESIYRNQGWQVLVATTAVIETKTEAKGSDGRMMCNDIGIVLAQKVSELELG